MMARAVPPYPQVIDPTAAGQTNRETAEGSPAVRDTRPVESTDPSSVPDLDAMWAAHRTELERKRTKLQQDARAVFKAMEGWDAFNSQEEAWIATCERSREEYGSGRFLLEPSARNATSILG
jgi:hypothetical protein